MDGPSQRTRSRVALAKTNPETKTSGGTDKDRHNRNRLSSSPRNQSQPSATASAPDANSLASQFDQLSLGSSSTTNQSSNPTLQTTLQDLSRIERFLNHEAMVAWMILESAEDAVIRNPQEEIFNWYRSASVRNEKNVGCLRTLLQTMKENPTGCSAAIHQLDEFVSLRLAEYGMEEDDLEEYD